MKKGRALSVRCAQIVKDPGWTDECAAEYGRQDRQ